MIAANASMVPLSMTTPTSQTLGTPYCVADLRAWRVVQAREAGLDGLILSAEEVGAVRARFGRDMILVTSAITPAGLRPPTRKER
jgi:orotidine-5'-phosphate decarboxylase